MWHFKERGIITKELYDEWLEGRHGEWKYGSHIYFVSSLKWTFSECKTWSINLKTGKPVDKNNHIIGGALKYVLAANPVYRGNYWQEEKDEDEPVIKRNKYVGG